MSSPPHPQGHRAFAASPPARRAWLVVIGAGLVALAGLWLLGLGRFVRAEPPFSVTLPVTSTAAAPPGDEVDLASWRAGPTVRASSYHRDPFAHHHPAFVVDGRVGPTAVEKWMSAPGDQHPWIEVLWREPHDVSRVVIQHAGQYEADEYTLDRYRLTCLRAPGVTDGGVAITGNRARLAIHPLDCRGARGIRLDGQPRVAGDPVRIYELEAWGR
jgi:hypothetical protein